ncbi:MAG: 3-deoxy-manno-octulosonate cytidylyltransferase [Saprospiraceae bacterium]|nr:3-deoxy-manno-octulosonate cytidylyltransferase [Saprospiraceae bacterium]
MKTLGVIPARYASTRFPAKPLVDIAGKLMIQRVYEQVQKASLMDSVIVATDDQRIFDAVKSFGGQVEMTAEDHKSGTDRCAEVAQRHSAFDLVVNIQGDEPFINPSQIDKVIHALMDYEGVDISTLAKVIEEKDEIFNPNVVKVVFGAMQQALYFSRNPIPFVRNAEKTNWMQNATFFKHIGLYGFRRNVLLQLAHLPQGQLEQIESLEQLRWLENGYSIAVGLTQEETFGIDTPNDLDKALDYLKGNKA